MQPCDVGAEQVVLAGVCQYGFDTYIDISDIISVSSFTLEANQAIYKCLEAIFLESKTIDLASIVAKSEQLKLKSLVQLNDIKQLFELFVKPENIRQHAQSIAKLEFARSAQKAHVAAFKQLQELKGSESIDQIVSISEDAVFQLTHEINKGKETEPTKFGDNARSYIEFLENNPCDNIGIPTPFKIYNEIIGGGLRKGYVDLIATRPGGFKSSTALNVGLHASHTLNIPTLYLDTEMTYEDQVPRLISKLTGVNTLEIQKGKFRDNREKIYSGVSSLEGSRFYYRPIHSKNFKEILSIIRRWIIKEVKYNDRGQVNDCLILYDYFKIMDPTELDDLSEHQAMGFQISQLTDFAKEYNFPCLAFVQVNRDGITKETSDIISQSDRLLWLCASCSVLKLKTQEEIQQDGKEYGNGKLITFKHRFGPGLQLGNYINMNLRGDICLVEETGTRFDVEKIKQDNASGFKIE